VNARRLRRAALALFLLLALVPAPSWGVTQAELHAQQLSVLVGPSPYGWNLVGVKKDIVREPQSTVFVTAGLGMIFAGVGAAWHPNGRDAEGPFVSGVVGVWGGQLGASYQWMVSASDSIHFGLHLGGGWVWDERILPIVAWERRL